MTCTTEEDTRDIPHDLTQDQDLRLAPRLLLPVRQEHLHQLQLLCLNLTISTR